MLFGSQSLALVDALRAQAGSTRPDEFLRLFRLEAERWLPPGFVVDVEAIRAQYEGRILPSLAAELRRRYPATYRDMSPLPFAWVRHVAEEDAAVYDVPPTREVEMPDDGEVSPEVDAAFASLIDDAHLDIVMAEAERRVSVAGSVFLRVRADTFAVFGSDEVPPIVVDAYWPSDVRIIPHPLAPTNLAAAYGIAFRQAAPAGCEAWEVWRRPLLGADDGVGVVDEFQGVRFGPWSSSLFVDSPSGDRRVVVEHVLEDSWPLALPVVRWDSRIPEGYPVVPADPTLVAIADALNVALTNEQFLVDTCAHPMLVEIGGSSEAVKQIGPGLVYPVGRDGDLRSVSQTTDFGGVREAINGLKANLGATRSGDSQTYTADPSTVASGIAMKIRNQPLEKKRREAAQRAVFVEKRLLAIMAELSDHYRGTSIISSGVRFSMTPGKQDEIEEPEAKQRRLEEAKDRGWISDAAAATAAGYYRTKDDAIVAGLSDELDEQQQVGGLASRLSAGMALPETAMPTSAAVAPTPSVDVTAPQATTTPTAPTEDATINELTLGIQRLGTLGDIETLNILREALAKKLGVPYGGDITPQELATKAAAAMPDAASSTPPGAGP